MIVVNLNYQEACYGVQCGLARHWRASKKEYRSKIGWSTSYNHMIAACSELALCKFLNIHFDGGYNNFSNKPDIGDRYEVKWARTTRDKPNPPLPIRPDADDELVYVLITGDLPSFALVGWCYGYRGKVRENFTTNDFGDVFMVPQDQLENMESIPHDGFTLPIELENGESSGQETQQVREQSNGSGRGEIR